MNDGERQAVDAKRDKEREQVLARIAATEEHTVAATVSKRDKERLKKQRHRASKRARLAALARRSGDDLAHEPDLSNARHSVAPAPADVDHIKKRRNKTHKLELKTANPNKLDHFLHNWLNVSMLNMLAVDKETRVQRYCVSTPGELIKVLDQYHPGHGFKRTTLAGWFVFPGKGVPVAFPQPKQTWFEGLSRGHVSGLSKAAGPKPILHGAEATLQKFEAECRGFREVGISLQMYSMRAVLVAMLVTDGHAAVLSPHLLDPRAAVDKSKFCCSDFWLHAFLSKRMGWSWRCSTKAAQKLPDDADEQVARALQRIAALSMRHVIPANRVFMADETFMFYTPESKCDPLMCIGMSYHNRCARIVQVPWHCVGTHGTSGVQSRSPQWGKRTSRASL